MAKGYELRQRAIWCNLLLLFAHWLLIVQVGFIFLSDIR